MVPSSAYSARGWYRHKEGVVMIRWTWLRWTACGGLLLAGSCNGVSDIVLGSLRLAFGIVDLAT